MGCTYREDVSNMRANRQHRLTTLPVLFSTHIAFFFRSMHSGPARVEVIVEGGT